MSASGVLRRRKPFPASALDRQAISRDSRYSLAQAGLSKKRLRQALPKPAKSLPEQMPRLARVPAHEDVRAIADGAVLDAVRNTNVAGQLAGRKDSLEVGTQKPRRDNGFRRRIAVPSEPVRVRATDHFRQAVVAAIEIDGRSLTGASPARTPNGASPGGSESRTRNTASVISRQPNSSLKLLLAASAILHQREPAGASGRTRTAVTRPLITKLVRTTLRRVPAAAGDRVSNHRSPQTAPTASSMG